MTIRLGQPARWLSLILILFALILSSCASSTKESGQQPPPLEPESAPMAPAEGSDSYGAISDQSAGAAAERLVIKNASLSVVVPDPSASMDRISSLAEEMGGFVVSANLSQDQVDGVEVPRASVTIRVPAERLDEALDRIQKESDRLPLSKNITSQDVTADYTDLQSRLRNLEAAEVQLREMMASATKTEDVLNIYQELTRTREQIEVIKGQIQYYEESARLSSISANLIATAAVRPLTIGSWQPGGVAREALQALIGALKFLVSAAIWIVLLVLPVGLLIGLPIYLLARLIRRRRSHRPAAPAAPSGS